MSCLLSAVFLRVAAPSTFESTLVQQRWGKPHLFSRMRVLWQCSADSVSEGGPCYGSVASVAGW